MNRPDWLVPGRAHWVVAALVILLAACAPASESSEPQPAGSQPGGDTGLVQVPTATAPVSEEEQYQIVTLLPRDAIPAIDDPIFISAAEAAEEYRPDELVIGVSFEGDSRAYSVELLSTHEIVNDTVGGRKIAITW